MGVTRGPKYDKRVDHFFATYNELVRFVAEELDAKDVLHIASEHMLNVIQMVSEITAANVRADIENEHDDIDEGPASVDFSVVVKHEHVDYSPALPSGFTPPFVAADAFYCLFCKSVVPRSATHTCMGGSTDATS